MSHLRLVPPIDPRAVRDLELNLLRARGQHALAAVAKRLFEALQAKGKP